MMKLLFLALSYPPPMEGGSRIYLYNLLSNLSPSDVMLYTNASSGHEVFDAVQAYPVVRSGLEAGDFGKLGKVRMWLVWLADLIPLLWREKVDILHVSDLFYVGPVAWLLARLFSIPYILYVFAEELNKHLLLQSSVWGTLRDVVCARMIHDAAGFVVVSDYTASLLEPFGVAEKKIEKVIPMVEPPSNVSEEELDAVKEKYQLTGESRVILCAGRLVARKGQDYLVRAMPGVLSRVPEAILIIVGRGPDGDRLRGLVDEVGVGEQTIFTGYVDEDELSALYGLSDVFAMPHRETEVGDTEGCPTVFLEANAHGKPVVGGKAGGVCDAIWDGETGFIVDGEEVDQIAKAIIRLLEDRDLAREFGERGRQRVLGRLSPKQGAARVWKFSNVVGSSSHSSLGPGVC